MAERIPHLTALRVFEAVARRASFQEAAAELGISPSAVSHQVRALEAYLEARLFDRLGRSVKLTEAGRALAPGLGEGFRAIEGAVREVRSLKAHAVLVISCGPSLAAKWLSPRLYRFEEAHPAIELRIAMSNRATDLAREDVDVALRHGPGGYVGLDELRLFGEAHSPVAAPALAETLARPQDLRGQRLFDDISARHAFDHPGWPDWFAMAGVEAGDWPSPRGFTQSDHALQAAIDGHGVLMARLALAHGDLKAGRLARPFEQTVRSHIGYFAVTTPGRRRERAIRTFLDWLAAEAEPVAAELP